MEDHPKIQALCSLKHSYQLQNILAPLTNKVWTILTLNLIKNLNLEEVYKTPQENRKT